MNKPNIVRIVPCKQSGIEFDSDDTYSCWRVICKEHGEVLDHGSLSFAAFHLMHHRTHPNMHEFPDVTVKKQGQHQ